MEWISSTFLDSITDCSSAGAPMGSQFARVLSTHCIDYMDSLPSALQVIAGASDKAFPYLHKIHSAQQRDKETDATNMNATRSIPTSHIDVGNKLQQNLKRPMTETQLITKEQWNNDADVTQNICWMVACATSSVLHMPHVMQPEKCQSNGSKLYACFKIITDQTLTLGFDHMTSTLTVTDF
eukprot:2312042-Amphidinium_carterae.1